MIPRDAMIHSLEQKASEAKPSKVRMRTDMVHETVLQLREKGDDLKLLEDWLAIEQAPSVDGWQWVEAKYLTWAAQSLRR